MELISGDIIFRMILGHIAGDYVFQNDWMALNKTKNWNALLIHCFIYMLCVGAFLLPELIYSPWYVWVSVLSLINVTHAYVDGSKFVNTWLDLIKGRSFFRGVNHYYEKEQENEYGSIPTGTYYIAFSALVYTVIDNFFHILINYGIILVFLTSKG